jgi:hypothetical protein
MEDLTSAGLTYMKGEEKEMNESVLAKDVLSVHVQWSGSERGWYKYSNLTKVMLAPSTSGIFTQ